MIFKNVNLSVSRKKEMDQNFLSLFNKILLSDPLLNIQLIQNTK